MARPFLILTLALALFVLLNAQSFLDNLWFYASGSVAAFTIKGEWGFALLNIAVFVSLLLFLGRRQINWKTHGLFSAFIVSLFFEMYGASLLLYFVSGGLGVQAPESHTTLFAVDLLGITLAFDFWMAFGAFVIVLGISIIALGWFQLWNSKSPLYTGGLYKHSRHPQYVGFLYTIWGWMIAWPTITTLLFTPILTYAYLNAAKKEEQHMLKSSADYKKYYEKTPFLL